MSHKKYLSYIFISILTLQTGCVDVSRNSSFRFSKLVGRTFIARYPSAVQPEWDSPPIFAPSVVTKETDRTAITRADVSTDWRQKGYSILGTGAKVRLEGITYMAINSSDQLEARGIIVGGPLDGQTVVIVGIIKEPMYEDIRGSTIPDVRYYVLEEPE